MKKSKEISLVTLRQAKGLSQRDLASALGISHGAIAQYETGNRKPTLGNALKIANFFSMPVDQIKFGCEFKIT